MTNDLIEWLRAQLDEDEQAARAATRGPWRIDPEGAPHGGDDDADVEADWTETVRLNPDPPYNGALHEWRPNVAGDSEGFGACSVADATHIVRWDPARVIAEVAAKRRIIDALERAQRDTDDLLGVGCFYGLRVALRLLASVYAGRPGWREEWATDEEVQRG